MNIENERDFDELKRKAIVLKRENAILADLLVKTRRELLEARGKTPEQMQQDLAFIDQQIAQQQAKLEEQAKEIAGLEAQANKGGSDAKKEREKRERSGPRPQPTLRVLPDEVHDLDDPDKQCPNCGGVLNEFGQDVTEEIDVIAREFVKRRHIRKKYACKCKSCVEMADMPPRLVPGGIYANNVAVEIAAMKYVDQIPFDRIARIFGREGFNIDSQTLWAQVEKLAAKIQPGWRALREAAFKEGYIGIDQTHWKVIGHEKKWQMWEVSRPKIAYFDIAETKGDDDGKRILDGYSGVVTCDAFVTHRSLVGILGTIKLAHCWAHVRQYVEELKASDPLRADRLQRFIRALYDVEQEAGDDVEKRRLLRDTRSRTIVDEIYAWRNEQRVLPSSPAGELLGYLRNHEIGFRRFLDDPLVAIDNNLCERGYLWPAIGRRSFVGSKSRRGTEVAAIFYSYAESARRCGLDPKACFTSAMDDALGGRKIRLPHELAADK